MGVTPDSPIAGQVVCVSAKCNSLAKINDIPNIYLGLDSVKLFENTTQGNRI